MRCAERETAVEPPGDARCEEERHHTAGQGLDVQPLREHEERPAVGEEPDDADEAECQELPDTRRIDPIQQMRPG